MCHNYNQCIKYTDDTEYLVGTREKAPLEYVEYVHQPKNIMDVRITVLLKKNKELLL